MPKHDIIVVGASAGGVEALRALAQGLPRDLPAAVFVVLHLPPDSTSLLPEILNRAGTLPAAHFPDDTPVEHGRIYIAPPNNHLLLNDGRIRLSRGPREHGHRPSVDSLFRSAAHTYGSRVVAVVLSGTLYDGALGARLVKAHGGTVVVQDPGEAAYPSMPESVLEMASADYTVSMAEMPILLDRLAREDVEEPSESNEVASTTGRVAGNDAGATQMPDQLERPEQQIEKDIHAQENGHRPNAPSVMTCPECGGVLWELRNGEFLEYRCHVGHAYSLESLQSQQDETLEMALWSAVRALAEKAILTRRLADRSRESGRDRSAARFEQQADDAAKAVELLRRMLLDGRPEDSGEDVDY